MIISLKQYVKKLTFITASYFKLQASNRCNFTSPRSYKSRKIFTYSIAAIFLLFFLCSCSQQAPAEKREKHLTTSKSDIVIGAVWPHDSFWKNMGKGAQMAINEVNLQGGVLGRKLKLQSADDEASVNSAMMVAQEFADNIDMVAVIGHVYSYLSLATASTYEFNGLIMLTPATTATQLTEKDHQGVFRMMPNNQQLGKYIADYMKKKGYKRVVIYYPRGDYGRDLANHFELFAYKNGITIVDRRSFLEQVVDHKDDLRDWSQLYRFDAMFLPASMPEAPIIIQQAREAGIHQPIIGGDAMDTDQLVEETGKVGEGTVIVTPFHYEELRPEIIKFIKDYRAKYHEDPDVAAAYGYDGVMLLVNAMRESKSVAPINIANYLHSGRVWQGVTGKYTYDKKGNMTQNRLFIKTIKNGKFVTEPDQ